MKSKNQILYRNSFSERSTGLFWSYMVLLSALIPITFSKWGTYLKIPSIPIYICDLLLATGCAGIVMSRKLQHNNSINQAGNRGNLRMAIWGFVLWFIVMLQVIFRNFDSSLELRDSAPLIYAMAVPFYIRSINNIGIEKVKRLVTSGLFIHTMWIFLVSNGYLIEFYVPFLEVPVLRGRADFDAGLCASAATLNLFQILNKKNMFSSFALFLINTYIVFSVGNRAAGIGLMLSIFWLAYKGNTLIFNKAFFRLRLVILVASFLLASLYAGRIVYGPRFLFTRFNFINFMVNREGIMQDSTADARLQAWELLLAHSRRTFDSFLFGYGPGSSALYDSGAVGFLSGSMDVRAPHNIFLFILLHFGFICAIIWSLPIITILVKLVWSKPKQSLAGEVIVLYTSLAITLFSLSVFGVNMEAPFGALVFYFSISWFLVSRGKLATQNKK